MVRGRESVRSDQYWTSPYCWKINAGKQKTHPSRSEFVIWKDMFRPKIPAKFHRVFWVTCPEPACGILAASVGGPYLKRPIKRPEMLISLLDSILRTAEPDVP
jgi:hypothetical protein